MANFLLISIVLIFISVLIIKRFVYFRPVKNFIENLENTQDIYQGNLHAWYSEGTVYKDKIILFCHGNGGNVSFRINKVKEILKLGFSVLIFDYSGYGKSNGVPNEQLLYSNASIFMEYIFRKGYKRDNIIPYGESLGAVVASYIAFRYSLPKVILESSLPNVKSVFNFYLPWLKFLSFLFDDFDTLSYLKTYRGKVLLMHCLNDEIIPISLIEPLKRFSSQFIEMEGGHNNPSIPWNEIKSFII